MSGSQQNAAANTFSKRYALCNALGILTGDEDTDAPLVPQTANPKPNSAPSDNGREKELAQAMGDQADGGCSPDQRRTIIALFQSQGMAGQGAIIVEIEKLLGLQINSTKELTEVQASQLIEALKKNRMKEVNQ